MCTNYSNWGKNLKMKLHIDYRCGKIYIIVAHSSGKIIEKRSYWDFETLYKLINQKLNCLCLCSYSITYRHCERFCKLDNYVFLEQLSFENFLKALEGGDIHVGVKYGVYKNGNRKGMSYNHGTSFNIKKNALFNLFEHF